MNLPILYIVIPCYNEEKVIPVTSKLFLEKITNLINRGVIHDKSRILFVNDGSSDTTWQIIKQLSQENEHFIGISQSKNRGHQSSLVAGLMESKNKCDITISIDCDGQDDINAIDKMIYEYKNGSEIVYGVRSSRKTDSFFKRITAENFYRILNFLGANIVFNHADYRLLSNKVLEEFESFKEVNLFLRGLIPLIGFRSSNVFYERHERISGKSHYSFSKMVSLAWDGITSLSVKPLHFIVLLGLIVATVSFVFLIWAVVSQFLGRTNGGWASIICIISFLGGIQLICTGVLGEYIGKIYLEVKRRPRFIISERTIDAKEKIDE